MPVTARIPDPPFSTLAGWLPPAVLGGLSTLLWCGGPAVTAALRYQRGAVAEGQWWRLLTDHFVHLGGWHLLLNLAGLAMLAALCPERLPTVDWLGRVLWIGLGVSLGLYGLSPAVGSYVGLSGLLYGLFALGLGRQALGGDRLALLALAFIAIRLTWPYIFGASAAEQRLIGGAVIAASHVYGVAAALLYGLIVGPLRRRPIGTRVQDTDLESEEAHRP